MPALAPALWAKGHVLGQRPEKPNIHKAIIAALESRKGFKRNDNDVCEMKEIIKSTTEGNKNVH